MKHKKLTAFLVILLIICVMVVPFCKKDDSPLTQRLNDGKLSSICSEKLTYAERRQQVVDFYELQLSFQWSPDMDVDDYPVNYIEDTKQLKKENYYSGIPYQSLGTGNLYRWMEYYDEKSGVMKLEEAFAENGGYGEAGVTQDEGVREDGRFHKKYLSFMTMFNQCSASCYWSCGRVLNSASFGWTYDVNVYNGFIPVGLFTYPDMTTIDEFARQTQLNPDSYGVPDIFGDWEEYNPDKTVYDCYAQMKPGDLIAKQGHVMMIKTVTVARKEDGSVDERKSGVTVLEQAEPWSVESTLDGKPYLTQGRNGYPFTFEQLAGGQYLPWTFAEYLDPEDEQDRQHLEFYESVIVPLNIHKRAYSVFEFTDDELKEMSGSGIEKARVFTTLAEGRDSITAQELSSLTIGANYGISDVFVTVKSGSGQVLLENIYRALEIDVREVPMSAGKSTHETDGQGRRLTLTDGCAELATGENTVEISLQLSTGEKLTAFSGRLMP